MSAKYSAPTVRKAFDILGLLSRNSGSLSLSDLARTLGISKSTAHGIVSALEDSGAIVRDGETRRLSLGLTLFELGSAAQSRIDLVAHARPVMRDLGAGTGESVFLGIRSGDHVTILDIVESRKELKITSPVGTRIPLLAGATGKVMLASMPDEEAGELVRAKGLRPFTPAAITDPDRFLEELRAVRRDGYAVDREEYMPGVRAVAAPVRCAGSRMVAVWVVGFTPSMDDAKLAAVAMATMRAAAEIGTRLEGRRGGRREDER